MIELAVGGERRRYEPEAVVIAGFTGRDQAAVAAHVAELAAEGIPAPAATPAYYLAPPRLLSQDDVLTVVGAGTSGEVELVVLFDGPDLADAVVTVGSDHTDRLAERHGIDLAKRACGKPIGRAGWPLLEVLERWDGLLLESWIGEAGEPGGGPSRGAATTRYQQATLAGTLPLATLLDGLGDWARPGCFALFTGTPPTIGGLRGANVFHGRLTDPATGHRLDVGYGIRALAGPEPRAASTPSAPVASPAGTP